MAGAVMIDLTALDSDDDDTPITNVALAQRASLGWVGVSPAAKRRRTSAQVDHAPYGCEHCREHHQLLRCACRSARCQLRQVVK